MRSLFTEAKAKYLTEYAASILVPSAGSQGGQFFKGALPPFSLPDPPWALCGPTPVVSPSPLLDPPSCVYFPHF